MNLNVYAMSVGEIRLRMRISTQYKKMKYKNTPGLMSAELVHQGTNSDLALDEKVIFFLGTGRRNSKLFSIW